VKVLHVVHGFPPESEGGVESYLTRLLPHQQSTGLDVALLTGSMQPWPQCGIERDDHAGIAVHRLHRDDEFFDWHGKAWHPGVEAAFAGLLAAESPDVVHVHHWIRLTANLVELAHAAAIPTVVSLHDVYTSCPRAFRVDRTGASCDRPLAPASCGWCVPRYGHETEAEIGEGIALFAAHTRSELEYASALLATDAAPAEFLAAKVGLARDRFDVVPLPYAPRLHRRLPPAGSPGPGEPLRIGHFGRLAPHKGVRVLLDAVAALCRLDLPRPIELHLFGVADASMAATLQAAARDLPVTVHGAYTVPTLAAAGLHCAVFPTLAFETHGFVLDEAFELGLPVVVSDLGALARRAGAAGLRVPPGDPAALTETLRALVYEPARLRALSARIPPPPPTLAEHASALASIYARVRAAPLRRDVIGVDPRRRTAFLLQQRESALRRITPPGGPA
jgi:glycosyltransferase involved in cell wall biosynthesis